MKLLLLSTMLLFCSCGKNTTTSVESPYNDSSIRVELVLQDARIKALEARLNAYETNFDLVTIEFNNKLSNIDRDFDTMQETLDNNISIINQGLAQLQGKVISLVKICSSNEYLIKTSDGMFAVYMVSNNYGTFLGKLANDVNYQTTDTVKANFKLVNNQLVCL